MARNRHRQDAQGEIKKWLHERPPSLETKGDLFVGEVNDLVAQTWRCLGQLALRAARQQRGSRDKQRIEAAKNKRVKLTAEVTKAFIDAASETEKARIVQLHNEMEPLDKYGSEHGQKEKEIQRVFLEIAGEIEGVDGINVVTEYLTRILKEGEKDDADENDEK